MKKYKEHVNDHQIQIVEYFDKKGYLKGLFNIEDLGKILKQIGEFKPNEYISNSQNILNILSDFIDKN